MWKTTKITIVRVSSQRLDLLLTQADQSHTRVSSIILFFNAPVLHYGGLVFSYGVASTTNTCEIVKKISFGLLLEETEVQMKCCL